MRNYGPIIAAVAVGVLVVVVLWQIMRGRFGGVVQLSHLRCPKCGSEFDYAWIPGGSFTAIRLGNSRSFGCPVCGKWSIFNVWDTRVDPKTHHCNIRIGPS